jgi:hypothetical protein
MFWLGLAVFLAYSPIDTAVREYNPPKMTYVVPGYLIDVDEEGMPTGELIYIGRQKRGRSVYVPDPEAKSRRWHVLRKRK